MVDARVMGTQIYARAWELLTAMVIMGALFGISGLIAVPVYYAYIEIELSAGNLIRLGRSDQRGLASSIVQLHCAGCERHCDHATPASVPMQDYINSSNASFGRGL